jgi:hypothetical protein
MKNIQDVKDALDGKYKRKKKVFGFIGSKRKKEPERKIGEVWFETDPKTKTLVKWEQKDGYRTRVAANLAGIREKLQEFQKGYRSCPKDECTANDEPKTRLDTKFQVISGMCADCHFKKETQLKIEGKFEEYAKERMKQNAISFLRDAKADVQILIEALEKTEFIQNAQGEKESWTMSNKEEFIRKLEVDFQEFEQQIKDRYEID